MVDSARHLQRWEDTMAKYHGEIERLVYAAEIHCGKRKGIWCGNRKAICPFKLDTEDGDCFCTLFDHRLHLGDHVRQDDVVRG